VEWERRTSSCSFCGVDSLTGMLEAAISGAGGSMSGGTNDCWLCTRSCSKV